MKHRIFRGLLAFEAVVCVLLVCLHVSAAGILPAAAAFPFAQIGIGLRALSLSGMLGNALAIAVYGLIGLLPAGLLLILRKKRKLYTEDWLLALLSAVLLFVLYLMINPGYIGKTLGFAANLPVGKAILGGTVYSLVIGYIIFRVLRLFYTGDIRKLERYMTIMLGVLSAVFVYLAFGACLRDLLSSISSLQAGNIGHEHLLGLTYVFLGLQYAVNALPYLLDVFVIFSAMRLLGEMRKARYASAAVEAAGHMSRICAIALTVTIVSNILFNLLQLLFASALMVMNSSVQIPIVSILFVLAALLMTRLIMESKQLKDENDRFI